MTGMPAPFFDFTVLMVTHVPTSQAFYQDALGLIPRKNDSTDYDGHYVELATGDHRLGLVSLQLMQKLIPDLASPKPPFNGVLLSFKVPDLAKAFDQAVVAGAEIKLRPTKQPWGQESAFLVDPDGHLIELVQR